MYGLKNYLNQEEERLKRIKQEVEESLKKAPPGKLRISSTGKQMQFFHCTEENEKSRNQGRFIKKDSRTLIKELAQKDYDHKMQKLLNKRLKQVAKLNSEYSDSEFEEIYDKLHPIRKALSNPYEIPLQQRIEQWKAIPYKGKEFAEGMAEIYTKKGERVRSKSEKILADTFYDMGIEYKYECPLKLKGYGTVYPDFTILSKKTGKEIYWEHDGRMDDPQYSEQAVKKINSYISNGIFPGDRLILTYETSNVVLNDRIIKIMIDNYLM